MRGRGIQVSRSRIAAVGITLVAVAVAATLVVVKALDSDAECGQPFAEMIDPNSSQHLLPGAPEPTYLSDPPTSGAHRPGEYSPSRPLAPISRAVQVTLLEQGEVLVQYRGVPSATETNLRAFARRAERVTVAPNRSLKKPIVATAWLWKMECDSFDADALRDFVDAHQPAQPVSD